MLVGKISPKTTVPIALPGMYYVLREPWDYLAGADAAKRGSINYEKHTSRGGAGGAAASTPRKPR